MKQKHFNDTFGIWFWVAVGDNALEAQKEVAEIFDDREYINCLACAVYNGNKVALCLPKDVCLSVVAHEAFHAAHRILERHHITLTEGSEEVYATMVEWCMKRTLQSLKKFGIKFKVESK